MRESTSSGCISRPATRTRKRGPAKLVLRVVVAQHVADVLAEEALDALAELLHAVDVVLLHAPGAVRASGGCGLKGGMRLFTS